MKSFKFIITFCFLVLVFSPKISNAQGDEGSCFLPGTSIQMQDGTTKKIEDVRVGDEIVGYDIKNNKFTKNIVEELEAPVRDEWFKIFLANGRILRTTDDHPIYVKEYDNWASIDPEATWKNSGYQMKTQQLKVGQQVMDLNQQYSKILFILNIPEKVQTYNLKRVSNNNSFFAEGILVHNKVICYKTVPPWWDNEYDAKYTSYDSSWSACSATACGTTGTQTKSWVCDYCGSRCASGSSRDCFDCKNSLSFSCFAIGGYPCLVTEGPGTGYYTTTIYRTCSAPACCINTSWSPSPSTVCSGTSFTQTSNCEDTRTATGTKDPGCNDASSYCSDSGYDNGCYWCTGTKTCSPSWSTYSPSCSSPGNVFTMDEFWNYYTCSGTSCTLDSFLASSSDEACGTQTCAANGVWREYCKDGDVWERKYGKDDSCNSVTGCDPNSYYYCDFRPVEPCEVGYTCREIDASNAECVPKSSGWTED